MSDVKKRFKVSVCVATFNHGKYIKDCLLSILMQCPDAEVEILVGDDCSTDDTGAIIQSLVEQYPGKFRFFRHEKNIGGCKNYQFLIAKATGDFIAHVDGDDFWLPGKLEAQLKFLEKHPECVAAYTNACVVDTERRLRGIFTGAHPELQDIDYLLRGSNYLTHSSLLYRAACKDDVLAFQGDFLDYSIHCKLALQGMLGYLNGIFVTYRAGVAGSAQAVIPQKIRELYWENLCEINRKPPRPAGVVDGMGNFLGQIIYGDLRSGRVIPAFQWLKKSWSEAPDRKGRILLFSMKSVFRFLMRALGNRLYRVIRPDALVVFHPR